eukprot:9139921-Alexandrium_andersonii.AAC.1
MHASTHACKHASTRTCAHARTCVCTHARTLFALRGLDVTPAECQEHVAEDGSARDPQLGRVVKRGKGARAAQGRQTPIGA